MNKQEKGDRHLYKCRAYTSGSQKQSNAKQAKMRDEQVAAKSKSFRLLFYSGSEVQRRHFCGACKGTQNRRTCCDRLRLTLRWQ